MTPHDPVDAVKTQSQLNVLATELAGDAPEAAARLASLSDSLATPLHSPWANLDLFRAYDTSLLAEEHARTTVHDGFYSFAEAWRNVLVLAPMIVTWVGIAAAVDGYAALTRAQPDADLGSFLFQWQEGFGGYGFLPWLTLSRVALIDGVLLALVFALTILVFRLARRLEMRRIRMARTLHDRLNAGLTDASLVLATANAAAPFSFVNGMEEAAKGLLEQLARERERMAELAERKESELTSLTDFSTAFEHASVALRASVTGLDGSLLQVRTSIDSMSNATSSFNQQQLEVAARLERAATTMSAASASQQTIADALVASGTSFKLLTDKFDMLVKDLLRSMQSLDASASGANLTSEQMSSLMKQMGNAQVGMLQAIERERAAQTNLANLIGQSSEQLRHTLEAIAESNKSVRAISQDLTRIANYAQRELPVSPNQPAPQAQHNHPLTAVVDSGRGNLRTP